MPAPLSHERRALAITVRELRNRRALKQEELQDRAGLSRNYLTGLERGTVSPTFDTIIKLCRGLEMTFTEFAEHYDHVLKSTGR